MNTLRLILLLLCAFPLLGAEATTFPLNCRTSTGLFLNATGEINVSKVVRKDADTATIQVEATGSPTTCTVKVSGRLEGMTNAVQIGSSTLDCTSPAALSFYALAWDYIKIELTALSGGSSPEVCGAARVISR